MVSSDLTVDVEDVGLVVCLRVPVRGTQQSRHLLAFTHWRDVQLKIFQCVPRSALHRRVEAQRLFHNLRGQGYWVGAEVMPLLRVIQKSEHPIADQVDGRLEARDEQQHEQRPEFGWLDLATLGRDQAADNVLARLAATKLDEAVKQPADLRLPGHECCRMPQRGDAVNCAAYQCAVPGELRGA